MTKKKIKLVISDVDSTLVIPRNLLPSTKVIRSAINLHKKGVVVCCATARFLSEMNDIASALKLKSYLILEGGSRIYNLKTKRYIWKKNIEKKAAKQILSFFEEEKLPYIFTENDKQGKSIKDVEKWEINEIVPINLNQKQIAEAYDAFANIHSIHCVEVGSFRTIDPSISCLHITDIHGTKQYAIFELLKLLNIDRKNALGIGDNKNDIPLLSACGVKVAMGNAEKQLKEIADWVAPPVWEDGFAKAMEKFVI